MKIRRARKRNHRSKIIAIIVALVCFSTITFIMVRQNFNKTLAVLDKIEYKEITFSDRKKSIKPIRANEIEETVIKKVDNKNNIENVKVNYKEIFKNDIFIGDSISEGLNYYEFIDDNNVIAKKGMSISAALNEVDKIVALNPKNIYILFGVNDMGATTSSKWIVEQYTKLIDSIKLKIPDANIYIQSIMPVLPKVEKRAPYITNVHISECNNSLMEMVKKEKINYLDVASVANSNQDLYEGDGVHFKSQFYPLWLNYVISNRNTNNIK